MHMVLVDDVRPAVSFMGWKVGSGRVDCDDAGTKRSITVDLLFSETGKYALCERTETVLADGATRLEASVVLFTSAKDVRRFVENGLGASDPVRDLATVAALDHSAKIWPWLRRHSRRVGSYTLPFAL